MTCNKIIQPEYTKAQIKECQSCKHASGKKVWCCLFGCNIGEQRIITPPKKIQYPSMPKMAGNLLKETGRHIAGGMKKRSDAEIARVMAICGGCELYVKDKQRCQKCGCKINIKGPWASAHCPIGKW